MSEHTLSTADLRSRIETLDVDLSGGTTAGYQRFQSHFALGSVQIAYGESGAIYDESVFPGVVYPHEELDATVVVSGDGTVAVVDARDAAHADAVLTDAVETLDELGLIVGDGPETTVVPAETVPFALDPPEVETIGFGSESLED
ncbi:hypothetical protein DVK02_01525 [Halobellus sp. Atlit-31R]|nr:hypothetical protein DVK02_01525 [Halobellus sp. Atlit-31R]